MASRGRPAAASPSRIASAMRRRGAEAFGAGAQDRRVARLQAERAGVGGDVGPALEDHADDAERRRDALDRQPVRALEGGEHPADGIGQSGNALDRRRDRLEAAGIEAQAIDEGGGLAARLRLRQILAIGGENSLAHRSRMRDAMAWSAAFFSAAVARPSRRAARRASRPRSAIRAGRSSLATIFSASMIETLARRARPVAVIGDGERHVVPVHHLGAAGIAQNAFDLAARATDDAGRLLAS